MTSKTFIRPNPQSEIIRPPEDSHSLFPDPAALLGGSKIDLEPLLALEGKNVLGVKDLPRKTIIQLCRFAALLQSTEIAQYHPLDGKLIITAFFEASTRTRISFESATLRLDGKIISIPDGKITGVKKGESLHDIGEMFNAYGDLVIMRHTETDSMQEIQGSLRLPLVNAGNGSGEHPTQALADWFALLKWRPELALDQPKRHDKIHLGILGTPGSMRAVRSFLLMALNFQTHIREITIVSEMADPLDPDLEKSISNAGIKVKVTNAFQDVLPNLDVIYMNSIAYLGDNYLKLDQSFQLNKESNLKKSAVIMHPLARNEELDVDLDATPHNLYFAQAHGAVFMRQALLISILGRLGRVAEDLLLR